MIQSQGNFYKKINTPNSTPKSININQYNKTINYKISNTNINNNITNFIYPFSPIDKFNKKFSRESEGSSHNSSDIKFEDSPLSLKNQILSPEDEDLYLNNKREISSTRINNNNNNNIFYDENYFLNYDINPEKFSKENSASKKILILDLDETLVHSSFYPFNSDDETDTNSDIFFTILFNNKYYDVYVLLRPYFHQFLEKMSKLFDIYIFTASIKEYAEPLLIKLDKKNLIKKKLFRENCTLSEDNKYIKDLNTLNENLKNVILLDNNPNSFRYNKCNGIPIKTWHFDQKDKELIKLIPFLNFLSTVDDVREYIPKVISNDEIDYNKVYNILNKNITIKKCEKKLINIIRKNSSNIKNKNKNYSNSKIKLSYPQLFTNNMSIKNNNQNKKINFFQNNEEENSNNNKIFASSINFNKFEERKNNNYTLNTNTSKYLHSPGTINFREPFAETSKNKISKNKTILYQTNLNMNKIKKTEKNKCIRSKSTYNFNDLSENINNKYSRINFNLINNNISNKNESKSNTNTNKNKKIKNYKSFNNYKHSYYNNYLYHRQKINEERASLFLENNEHYLFTLNQYDNYLNNNYINNNMMNNNISNKSLEQKMSLSSRMVKIKNNNKKQKNNQSKNDNNKINQIKQQKDNLFGYKNFVSKNNIENNKNEESDCNMKYNNNNIHGMDYNKIHNFKNKKSNSKKVITGRNNENLLKRSKNMDKFISVSKTTECNKDIINTNNNINYLNNEYIHQNRSDYMNKINNNNINTNNENNEKITKKIICSTLNNHHMNNHKKLKEIIEENKNNTMEITKNIKSRFFIDETNAINLKGIPRKNKSMNNKKSNINYNKTKKNINREINLLNQFLKEFNNSKKNKNSKMINEHKEWKDFNTQRESRYIPNKNIFNYNCGSICQQKQMNKEELIKKEKNDDKYHEDKMDLNYYRKSQNYRVNKGNNNYLRKKMKNINYENNYMNFKNQNDIINNNEIVNYTNVKNMKYSSMEKSSGKNKSQKNSEMFDKKGALMSDKNNYLMQIYYSYANNKS